MQALTLKSRLPEGNGRTGLAACIAGCSSGCDAPMSALHPSGEDAQTILQLFWWMVAGGVVIWLLVMGLALYALKPRKHDVRKARVFIWAGGVVFPTVVLAVLLAFGLAAVPAMLEEGDSNAPDIRVTGEQWWWRIEYTLPDGRKFETANEVRLPVGIRTSLRLESSDVIHAFWVPKLAGKVDAIPGRTTRLGLEPLELGTYVGICAEYCGASHARMLLHVVVLSSSDFEQWVQDQLKPAAVEPTRAQGVAVFNRNGCAACHTIRGTAAKGLVGPDLTHVASRTALGSGILPNDRMGFRRWLLELSQLKPEVHMPSYQMMNQPEFEDLLTFLESLK